MAKVVMYTARLCPYCRMADRLFERKGIAVEKIMVDESAEMRTHMVKVTGRTTVPQIFIGNLHIGGYMELAEMDQDGQLDALLK